MSGYKPHSRGKQSQPTPQLQQQTKRNCKVFVANLEKSIQKVYLCNKFEECGHIVSLKINKSKKTQESNGTAVIKYSYAEFAEDAIKKFHGQLLSNQVITVEPYVNIYKQKKKAYNGNLDEQGLLVNNATQSIIMEEKAVTIEKFNAQIEHEGATHLQFRAISEKTPNLNPKFIKAYEYGWKLQIEDYFRDRRILKSVYVEYDTKAKQPWAELDFNEVADVQDAINECETTRGHACLKSSANKVWNLLLHSKQYSNIQQMVLRNRLTEPKNSE